MRIIQNTLWSVEGRSECLFKISQAEKSAEDKTAYLVKGGGKYDFNPPPPLWLSTFKKKAADENFVGKFRKCDGF